MRATSRLRFMDAETWSALPEFGLLDVELEESAAAEAVASGGSGGSGGGGSGEEGFAPLARRPALLSHALISGLLGGISPQELMVEYAKEGEQYLARKLEAVKAFFDSFDGWLGVEGRAAAAEVAEAVAEAATEAAEAAAAVKRESEGGGGNSATTTAASSSSLVVVGWWEA